MPDPNDNLDVFNLPTNFRVIPKSNFGPPPTINPGDNLDLQNLPPNYKVLSGPTATETTQIPIAELDINKLNFDIINNETVDDATARSFSSLWLAHKLNQRAGNVKVDPFQKGIYESSARAFYGIDHDHTDQEIYEGIRNSLNPPLSNPQWQKHEVYKDIMARQGAGEEVPDVEIDIPWYKEAALGAISAADRAFSSMTGTQPSRMNIKRSEKAEQKAFRESPIDQRKLGEQIMTEEGIQLAQRSMLNKEFNYGEFLSLKEESDKQYFMTYLKALNTEKDVSFVNEVSERVGRKFGDITESFSATADIYSDVVEGVNDDMILYLKTRGPYVSSDEDRRAIILKDIKLRESRGEALKFGKGGASISMFVDIDKGGAERGADFIMEDFSERFERGKAEYEAVQAQREFASTIRKRFVEKEGVGGFVKDVMIANLEVGVDLAGAMLAGATAGGLGVAMYSAGRITGDLRNTLISQGADVDTAAAVAFVTAFPYVLIEQLQVRQLSGLIGENFKRGFIPFAKDYTKTYAAEFSEETAQAFIENMAQAYVKEFAASNDEITYDEIAEGFFEEVAGAAKGFMIISGIGPARRQFGGRRASSQSKPVNKYNDVDTNRAMDDRAEPADYNAIKNALGTDRDTKFWLDMEMAETDQAKQDVIDQYNMGLSLADAKLSIQIRKDLREEVEPSVQKLEVKRESELQQLEDVTDRTLTPELIQGQVGKYGTIETIAPNQYKITGEGGGEFNLDIKTETEFQGLHGDEKLGVYDAKTKTITLPDTATDFKLSHEFMHAIEDMNVLNAEENVKFLNFAKSVVDVDAIQEANKGADQSVINSEILAEAQEKIKRDGIPKELNTIWQKITSFIQDMIAKVLPGRAKSGLSLAKEIASGQILQRKAAGLPTADITLEETADIEITAVPEEVTTPAEEVVSAEEIVSEEVIAPEDFDIDFGMLEGGKETSADIEAARAEKRLGEDKSRFYSREQQSSPERLAVVNLAKQLYKGTIVEADAEAYLESKGIVDPVLQQEAIDRANTIVNAIKSEIQQISDDKIINKAIRSEEIQQYYGDRIAETYRKGFATGEALEKAIQKERTARAQKARQEAKKAVKKPKSIVKLNTLIRNKILAQMRANDESGQNLDITEIMEYVEDQVVDTLIKEGMLIKGAPYRSDITFIETYKAVLADVAARINAAVTPKKKKDDVTISEWVNKLQKMKSSKSVEDSAASLLESLDKNRLSIEEAEKQRDEGKKEEVKELEAIGRTLVEGVEEAQPFVEKVNKKTLLDQLGNMNVRGQLESVMAYASESAKKNLEKILLLNDASKIKKKQRIKKSMNELGAQVLEQENIKDIVKWRAKRSKTKEEFKKFSANERTDLSVADLMALYMSLRQESVAKIAKKKDKKGNLENPDLNRRLKLLSEIGQILSSEEKSVAMIMKDVYDKQIMDANNTYSNQYGKPMPVRDADAFPIKIQYTQGGFDIQAKGLSAKPAFTDPKKLKGNDLDERANIFDVFGSSIEDVAHYIETNKSQQAIRIALTNKDFRNAIRNTFGDPTLKEIDRSVINMAADRAVDPAESNRAVDFVRSIMSTTSIGFNPKSMLVAATGSVNIFATRKGIFSSTVSAMKQPGDVVDDMKFIWNSIVVKSRMSEGISEGMKHSISRAKGNEFIRLYQKFAFLGITRVDGFFSSIFGGIIYNEYKNSEAAAGLTQAEVEANGLALVNRSIQEAYQPTEPDFLPSDINKGNSFSKAFFQFKTEPKSKLGIYFRDIKQIRAKYRQGDKSGASKDAIGMVIGQHLLVPGAYWLAGELMRGALMGDDEEKEGALRRLAVGILMGPAAGLLIWGTGLELLFQGLVGDRMFLGSSIPSDKIMNEVGIVINTVNSDKEVEEKIDKILKRNVPPYRYMDKLFGDAEK